MQMPDYSTISIYLYSEKYILAFVGFIASFIITLSLIPLIIRWSERKNLLDQPNARKVHKMPISRFGGIGIFAGFMMNSFIWFFLGDNYTLAFLILSLWILFIIGVVDDFKELSPKIKFLGQFLAAFIICFTGLRIESLYGIFGIVEMPLVMQYVFTIILITGIINALNLIDGIDGLAGGLGFISTMVLFIFLILQKDWMFAIVAISLGGALLAFLRFNFSPAKIFMGDAGSLVTGFILAILGIKLISGNYGTNYLSTHSEAVVIVTGILLVPVYDTIRVFVSRMLQGNPPFQADKTHIHHLILFTGLNHRKAALVLYVAHILVIITAILIRNLSPAIAILLLAAEAVILSELLTIRKLFLMSLKKRVSANNMQSLSAQNKLMSNHFKEKF